MSTTIAQAKHETGGWRGLIAGADGNVLTRTVNLYPDSDKAIAAAQRLWAVKQSHLADPVPGGAA